MDAALHDDFPARFDVLRRAISGMIEAEPRGSATAAGPYWAGIDYWMNVLMRAQPLWARDHFRNFVRDSLSDGYPRDYKEGAEIEAKWGALYDRHAEGVPAALLFSEPPFAATWGFDWKGRRISHPVIRLQRAVSNMHRFGALNPMPRTVLEIGAGHGVFAWNLLNALPRGARYIIIDIPPILILSATMLAIQRPDLRQGFTADSDADVLILPHYALEAIGDRIDLAVNTLSFGEMAEESVDAYAAFLARNLDGVLYSENMRRHPHNYAMRAKVPDILGRHLHVFPDDEIYTPLERQVHLMFQPYVHFAAARPMDPPAGQLIGFNFELDMRPPALRFA